MQRVGIADRVCNVLDRELGQLQKLSCLDHAVMDQEFLRCLAECLPEDCPEVATVESTLGGNILHRDIILKVLLDKCKSFPNIKILDFPAFSNLEWSHGSGQKIQKKETVTK